MSRQWWMTCMTCKVAVEGAWWKNGHRIFNEKELSAFMKEHDDRNGCTLKSIDEDFWYTYEEDRGFKDLTIEEDHEDLPQDSE